MRLGITGAFGIPGEGNNGKKVEFWVERRLLDRFGVGKERYVVMGPEAP